MAESYRNVKFRLHMRITLATTATVENNILNFFFDQNKITTKGTHLLHMCNYVLVEALDVLYFSSKTYDSHIIISYVDNCYYTTVIRSVRQTAPVVVQYDT